MSYKKAKVAIIWLVDVATSFVMYAVLNGQVLIPAATQMSQFNKIAVHVVNAMSISAIRHKYVSKTVAIKYAITVVALSANA